MLGKLNDALREAGASDVKAREAAEEVAAYEKDMNAIRVELARLNDKLDGKFIQMDSRFNHMQWEVRLCWALTAAVLVKLFVS